MKFESSSAISKGLGNALEILSEVGSLPLIRGTWYYVDPEEGSDNADGRTIDTAVQTIRAAYDKCKTSVGDGIVLLAYASTTTADTTAYLGGTLVWAKHGITVVGIASQQVYNCRARIASIDRSYSATTQFSWTTTTITDSRSGFLTQGFQVGDAVLVTAAAGTAITSLNVVSAVTASTLTLTDAVTANATPGVSVISTHCRPLVNVTGRGNRFFNVGFVQNGSVATDDGAVLVSADYNNFENCHFNGATNATPAAEITSYDLTVNSSENRFRNCTFGSNSTIRAAANAHIVLGVSTQQIGQNFFEDCYVISYSATAGHMGIAVTDNATLGGWIQFKDCSFVNWNSGALTALTSLVGGVTTPSNRGIIFINCSMVGWAIFAHADSDACFTNLPASANHGGRAVVTNT